MSNSPRVRTHSVRQVVEHADVPSRCRFLLECRGCGRTWPAATYVKELERQPCGTPEGTTP